MLSYVRAFVPGLVALVAAFVLTVTLVDGGSHDSGISTRESRVDPVTVSPVGDIPDVLDAAAAVDEATAVYLSGLEVARLQAVYDVWVAEIEARWFAVGRCEQPTADGGIQWTLQSSVYSGGLGISNAAWVQWGGLAYASNAGLATPWQQMMVAEAIKDSVGRSAWGCPVP